MSPQGIIGLEKCCFKVTPPNQFNDPYEFIPKIIGQSDLSETKEYLSDIEVLKDHYEKGIEQGEIEGSFEQFHKEITENLDQYADSVISFSSEEEVQWSYAQQFLDIVSEMLGVFCVSKNATNILMWSHYADSHSGIVLGLDENDSFFSKSNGVYDVEYVDNRPLLDLAWLDGDNDSGKFTTEIIKKKYMDWSYEKEVRATFSLSDCEYIKSEADMIYLRKFSPSLIKEVILGCRSTRETEERVKNILNQKMYSHVALKKASLDPNKYAIGANHA